MAQKRYLLDTHCLLWFLDNSPILSEKALKAMEDPQNTIYFSQITLFEIAIKQNIGKLPDFLSSTREVYEQALKSGFSFLPIQNEQIDNYQDIPLLAQHRDPFDRLLIATAYTEDLAVITIDEKFHLYIDIIEVLW